MEAQDNIKASPTLLFADESLCLASPEAHPAVQYSAAAAQHVLRRNRSPIRRLTFEHEAKLQSSNVPVEINKVADFKKFVATPEKPAAVAKGSPAQDKAGSLDEEDSGRFYRLKSSPMQMFNSFSPSQAFLSQTIGQGQKCSHGGLMYSEGKLVTKKMCCNCKKSHCLKLYCECFSNKGFCSGCNCINCLNTPENEAIREKAMQATLERNPVAFDPKITRAQVQSPP